MSLRRAAVHSSVAVSIALIFFGLGTFTTARQSAQQEARINALRAEMAMMVRSGRPEHVYGTAGTMGGGPVAGATLAALVEDIKQQIQHEMGLVPLQLVRDRRESFVELYSSDNRGGSSYGTAGYLGDGYFITVKHGVVALGRPAAEGREPRRIVSVRLLYQGREIPATVVDAGDAELEVDPGDWAIIRVKEPIDLPALRADLDFPFNFADPIFRLGNDYSKGISVATGYIGQRTPNSLVTCLTDGHPGVSGGGVLDQKGDLVGIPVGRMQGDFRFSFILPLRAEMFRKIPGVLVRDIQLTD
jgi:S1-C subfamily serine protease